ncbi:MAG: ATP-binding protein [Candidatus Nanohalarchaeota archaeon]|nr:MAG: ATP-binding protein [Candidatus Nanohaloarchaeota archaeon]
MEITKFINRKEELSGLESLWDSNKAQFVVVYGRRRVGKTELIKRFAKDKTAIYFLAKLESEKEQLHDLSSVLADAFNDAVIKNSPMTSWESIFEYLYRQDKKIVFVIDEFPNIVQSPRILSVMQQYWDEKLKNTKIYLILCGSSLSMMEKYIFDYKTPIYGRRTYDLKLPPLKLKDISEFFPAIGIEETIRIYSVLGGTPSYLLEYKGTLDNTLINIVNKRSFLYREPEFVLREEVNEPRYFMSILHAISTGLNTVGEIVNYTGIDRGIIGKYISILIDLDMVEKEISITDTWKSRKGNYFLKDNFFNFWFRFIYSNMGQLEYNPDFFIPGFKKNFNTYLGFTFEKVCKEFLVENSKLLPGFTKMGRWWHKNKQIDIVSLNEETKQILFTECKWKNLKEKQAIRILKDLEEKSKYVDWNIGKREEYFALIAKNIENKAKLRKQGYLIFDLDDF